MESKEDRIFCILGDNNKVTVIQKDETIESYECIIETLDFYKMMFLKRIERMKKQEIKDNEK